jgi:enamine deaminase RidA (YjgF/YER057c/UK114 family)
MTTPIKQALVSDRAPEPAGPYSQGIVCGDLLFTAGFGPQDRANGNAVADDVAEQTRQVLRNIQAVLAEHGATMDQVLKTTVHLADLRPLPGAHHRRLAAGEHPGRDRRRRPRRELSGRTA